MGPSQGRQKIIELEKFGELGRLIAEAYRLAIDEYPFLSVVDINIVGVADNEAHKHTGGSALHMQENPNGTGRPQISINLKEGIDHYRKLLVSRKVTAAISAEKAGLTYDQLSPQLLAMFIFLHELGHSYDYIVNVPNIDQKDARRNIDLQSLPFKGKNPIALRKALEPGGDLDDWWIENEAELKNNGYDDRRAFVEAQERAYHDMPSEDISDRFAAQILRKYLASTQVRDA